LVKYNKGLIVRKLVEEKKEEEDSFSTNSTLLYSNPIVF